MRLRPTALSFLAALSLSAVTFAAEPEDTSQLINENATAPAPAAEATEASDAAEVTEDSAKQAKAAEEMSPEEAAQAAVNGEIEYAKEKIDPHKATAAEIAAHNATAAPDDKIVCRREQLTGTHRGVKVCMTVGQRRALMEETQRGLATSGRNSAGDMRGE